MTRNKLNFHTSTGFHLIEILITIAIIGILSLVSFPIYSEHITEERRLEAANTLSKLALALEEFHFTNNTYDTATLTNLHFPETIAENSYRINIVTATKTDYIISATPINKQANSDSYCGTLTLNSYGEKSINGKGSINECW
jgi:type IV pilus assembly protein PilE